MERHRKTFLIAEANLKYSIIKEESLYKGFFEMRKILFTHELYQGGTTDIIEREIFMRGHSSCILLFDPKLEQLVLVEQFRIAASFTCESPWSLELVAGMIDKGFSAEQIAIKEAKEEANIDVQAIEPICSYLATPGGSPERVWLFLGIIDSENADGVFGLESENEDIKVLKYSLEQVVRKLDSGEFDNAPLIIGVQWLLRNMSKISQKYTKN
jgi:ADP-ribose pyrophosphatase